MNTCPYCDKPILHSVGAICGWCGKELPDGLRPTKEEIALTTAEEQKRTDREKRLDRIAREAKQQVLRIFLRFRP